MTMVTAMAMYEELLKYDNVDVYLTHTEDVNLSLADRAQFAEERNADFYSVFITMHPWIMTCSVPKYGSLPYSHTMPTAINSAGNRCNR